MVNIARKAIAISAAFRYVSLLIQFVATTVLARLLTPTDIGIYSAAFSVIALGHLFRDFGLNQYLIQEKALNSDKIRATFFLTLIISWSIGLILFFLAGPTAAFLEQPGVEKLMHLLCINFFIIPFGVITLTLLRKELKFHITSSIAITATLAGVIVSISTAYYGAGYFCLAYGALVETGTTVLLSLFFRPKDLPILPHPRGSKRILGFASSIGVGNIASQFCDSAGDLLIARILGTASLGMLSRAYGTFMLFDQVFASAIKPTILPLFSKANKSTEDLNSAYLLAVEFLAAFAWPFFAFLAVFTFEIVRFLYGTQWDEAIILIKILCVGGFLLPPVSFITQLFIAASRADIILRLMVYGSTIKLILIGLACFHGLTALSIAISLSVGIRLFIGCYYAKKYLNIGIRSLFARLTSSIRIMLASLIPPILVSFILPDTLSIYFRTPILLVTSGTGWLIAACLSKHPVREEIHALYKHLKGRLGIAPK